MCMPTASRILNKTMEVLLHDVLFLFCYLDIAVSALTDQGDGLWCQLPKWQHEVVAYVSCLCGSHDCPVLSRSIPWEQSDSWDLLWQLLYHELCFAIYCDICWPRHNRHHQFVQSKWSVLFVDSNLPRLTTHSYCREILIAPISYELEHHFLASKSCILWLWSLRNAKTPAAQSVCIFSFYITYYFIRLLTLTHTTFSTISKFRGVLRWEVFYRWGWIWWSRVSNRFQKAFEEISRQTIQKVFL